MRAHNFTDINGAHIPKQLGNDQSRQELRMRTWLAEVPALL
jgi:hypothetical protein